MRGIQKGDSLSLNLFVVCMERLVHIIDSVVTRYKWKPIPIRGGGPQISNLMFADDLVFFAEATEDQAQIVKVCLELFYGALGQKISHKKSWAIFSTNMSCPDATKISGALEF